MIRGEGLALANRLDPVSIEVREGELVCLIGPNGSGKTSLLHALAGIGGAAGRVEIDGSDLRSQSPAQRSRLLAFLPAGRDVHWPLSVRDVVALSGAGAAEIDAAMDALDLQAFAARRLDRLSTGERSRALIARALAATPKLLLLDEPIANLDPLWQIRLMEMLRGRTAMVAMHDLDSAALHADRLILMSGGRIAADGPPLEVMAGPAIGAVFWIEKVDGEWRPAARGRGRS